jgi:hypothetical protein
MVRVLLTLRLKRILWVLLKLKVLLWRNLVLGVVLLIHVLDVGDLRFSNILFCGYMVQYDLLSKYKLIRHCLIDL